MVVSISLQGEERCFDAVLDDILERDPSDRISPIHIINVEIKDTNEDSLVGATFILKLVDIIHGLEDKDDQIEECVDAFARNNSLALRYSVAFN